MNLLMCSWGSRRGCVSQAPVVVACGIGIVTKDSLVTVRQQDVWLQHNEEEECILTRYN